MAVCHYRPIRRGKIFTWVHEAVELGVNFFDTADLYDKGMNEEIVGKAIKKIRNKIVLATKVGNQWRSDGSGWGLESGQSVYPAGRGR